jgi:peptidoglycan/LPS O-acetylase OafA/YrhL
MSSISISPSIHAFLVGQECERPMKLTSRLPFHSTIARAPALLRIGRIDTFGAHKFNAATHLKNAIGHSYRADIDGLRALAVLAVVVFHAFPKLLEGGFVGVDVFFVISGFLITGIIVRNLEVGTFAFSDFYARRIRRIFPALTVVMCSCFVFGWIALLPDEFELLGKHLSSGAVFVSNLVYLKEAGYFDIAAEYKPLLHLWSLGVEEQFYMAWPLILYIASKARVDVPRMVVYVLVLSLLINLMQAGLGANIELFYSPLTRFWELLIGASFSLATTSRFSFAKVGAGSIFSRQSGLTGACLGRVRTIWSMPDLRSVLGMVLVVIALATFNRDAAYPSWRALLPTLGACLIISAGPKAWFNRHVLSHRLLVWLGLISYPLYLWHWPILSFMRILEPTPIGPMGRIGAIMVATALAWVTFEIIERPIRFSRSRRWKVGALCAALALVGAAGFVAFEAHGFPHREVVEMNPHANTAIHGAGFENVIRQCGVSEQDQAILDNCVQDIRQRPRYALWGDSKAEALYWGLVRESAPNERWMFIGNTAPVLSEERIYMKMARTNQITMKAIVDNRDIKVVALVTAVRQLFRIDRDDSVEELANSPYYTEPLVGLTRSIKALQRAGKKVVFVVDNPTLPTPKDCMTDRVTSVRAINAALSHVENPRCKITYQRHLELTGKYRKLVADLKRMNPELIVYDPTHLLCDIPKNVCAISANRNFLYSYGDHISDYASSLIARELLPIVRRIDDSNAVKGDSAS